MGHRPTSRYFHCTKEILELREILTYLNKKTVKVCSYHCPLKHPGQQSIAAIGRT